MKVGILALQGDVSEHLAAMDSAIRGLAMDGQAVQVRRPAELDGISALLMPGGESTTIAKQLDRFGLRQPIIDFGMSGKPIMGTCAGCIILSSNILDQKGRDIQPLGLVNMSVRRNAFGRQAESFERPLRIDGLDSDFHGIFIRAPRIVDIGENVRSLASVGGEHLMVRQGNILALTFHPELAADDRIHIMFLKMIRP